MSHVAAQSLDAPPRPTPVTAPPLARLEPDLDRQLADACRLVAAASTIATTVTLVADLTSGDEDTAWLACDRRVAELVHEYGVEVWLAQEELQVRIRIEQYEPALPPLQPPATEGDGAANLPDAPRRRAAPLRWWRDRGGRR
jgi:hypothetical protein